MELTREADGPVRRDVAPRAPSKRWSSREWKSRLVEGDVRAAEPGLLDRLQTLTGLSRLALRVCVGRGLTDAALIQSYLEPKLETLVDPMRIKDMNVAIDRLVEARTQGEKIRIYGDYDVDGTTGAALLSWVFRDCGLNYDALQPDRFKDGYGLGVPAVDAASESGIRVLVTVDCGITSFAAALRARELGIDLIIVDHHQIDPVKGLPEARAIVNPQRADCESGLKQLCGCGLAFYLARALRARGRALTWWKEGSEPNLKQHLDLVVMATSADMVPLTGDNHTLVRHGLQVLKQSKKPGVRALLEASGIGARGDVSPGHLGFVIGPRINASGRMGSASRALELLTTTDVGRATSLAFELETANRERGELQNRIWDEVRSQVEKGIQQGRFKNGIVVADPGWHEGVVGIVASRVAETFRKPAAVVAVREDFGKGSVRSFAGKDVLQALRESAPHLLGFGGHRHAAGLTVAIDQIDRFAESFDRALGNIPEEGATRALLTEGEADLHELDTKTLREIESLGPFGPGNAEPIFTFRAVASRRQVLKGRHFKLSLKATDRAEVEAIWFHAAECDELTESDILEKTSEWAAVPELNRFRGRVTPTLRIRDWRPT